MSEAPLLSVSGLHAWYGESHILHGVEFEVGRGEVVTLLGRNGAGKTTTLKSVMGMVARRQGSVRFEGKETISLSSDRIARLGLAFCPEERGIFASLDVEENLLLPPEVRQGGFALGQVFGLFPNLKERLSSQGTKLSGGEQQTASCARGRGCSCSTSRPRGWLRLSCSRSVRPSRGSRRKGLPSCWSSRISASLRGSPTAIT